jgi:hypothetical protein
MGLFSKIRFDGYYSSTDESECHEEFLRFYSDGSVVMEFTTNIGQSKAMNSLTVQHANSLGSYSISGDTISINLEAQDGDGGTLPGYGESLYGAIVSDREFAATRSSFRHPNKSQSRFFVFTPYRWSSR